MNWALYGIRSTQNTSIYIYIYISIMSTLWLKLPLNIIDCRALWPNGGVLESHWYWSETLLILIHPKYPTVCLHVAKWNYCHVINLSQLIGHFRVPKTLSFKMRPRAQPLLWKCVLFAWEWKIISISKAEHLTSFWYRGLGELGSGLFAKDYKKESKSTLFVWHY